MNEKIELIGSYIQNKLIKELYINFMNQRFPEERDNAYLLEWKDRFETGEPENWMDNQSKEIYGAVLLDKILNLEVKK